ncbi:hypothetical protein RHGRI_038714 [Rhododendron griersonianum]|uniref:PB1 domain-containing protein n=1 Tax=Rhododendron griersonianum TaxID=479676 RepID=A0AAV6HLI3_9ERIC|nr:hypothetical protein RHGRI_038714 [Rhododendron griersonianum]
MEELEERTTLEELGMDPENEGIISDLLRFVRDKEEFFRKPGKDWKRGYLFCDSPGTDRLNLIAAMANFLEFDIYHLDLTGLTSISELTNVLVSIRNRSVIAIQDFDQWAGKLPDFKTEFTLSVLKFGLSILIYTHSCSRGEDNSHFFLSEQQAFDATNAHLVKADERGPTVSNSEKGCMREALKRDCLTNARRKDAARGLCVWRPPNQLEGQTTQFTTPPNPNALVFPQFQIASTQVLSENEDRRNSLASQVEAFLMGRVSESSNLAFPEYSDAAAPSQPVATILQTMPMTTHMIPQTGGFSGIFQLEGQLTQSTSHPNPNVVVPPEPQIASTQMLSENMGSLENWEEFLSLEEETSLGGHVFGSVNLTVTTCCDPSLRQQPVPTNRDMMPTTHVMSHLVAREDIRSVTVKVSYGDRTIKFQVPLTSRIIEVKEEVKKRLKLEPSNFDFEYKDEDDGDLIFLGCDEDLTNHLQLFSNRVIRLLVVDSDASTKNICESCGSLKRKRQ